MRRAITVLRWIGILLLIVVLVVVGGGYGYLRQSLPMTSGTVKVNGVQAPIEIIRDVDAVPHIYAQNRLDAFFGLGYAHAQDRLWQMEFQRRVGQGRLSEILGEPTVGTDRFLRVLGTYRAATSAWERLPTETKAMVDAYTAGINAFITAQPRYALPPEFTLLRSAPAPWTGPDVLVWAKMMALDSSGNYWAEMLRSDLSRVVGAERAQQLMPDSPVDELAIIPARAASRQTAPSAATTATPAEPLPNYEALLTHGEDMREVLGMTRFGQSGTGSNNWVVDGTKSTTGKPLLANDPHLAARLPSTWYLAHLSAGDWDVIGATIPGLPGVVIGRNRSIAWGITNLFPDVQDLYRERLDESGQFAEFQGQMEPIQTITETIKISGQPEQQQVVRITRHGPLLSDVLGPEDLAAVSSNGEAIALRWTALEPEDGTVAAFIGINLAQDWDSFRAALRSYVGPAQNFVYADVQGNIGYYGAGVIPIRTAGDGLLPAQGWTGADEWSGIIPFEELPHSYNPPEHFIVSANNRPIAADYPHFIARSWDKPYRAQRIQDLLQAKAKLSPDDFAAIQADTVSLEAREQLPLLLAMVTPTSDAERAAIDLLKSWDGNTAKESAASALFAAWYQRLPRAIVGDELGPRLGASYQGAHDAFLSRFLAVVLAQPTNAWCDDTRTAPAEDCRSVADQTFRAALTDLQQRLGTDISAWRWEQLHRVVFEHQPLGQVDGLNRIFNRVIANGGDYSTINVGAYSLDGEFRQSGIPSYRQIIDLGSTEHDQFIHGIGQSGHVLSPHYDDYLNDWQTVAYRPLRLERALVMQDHQGTLRLEP